MTSRPRFPLGLTLGVGVVFAILVTLGVWQLQRQTWKGHTLTRIAAQQQTAPQPIGAVLARAAQGEDVSFARVVADCAPGPASPPLFRMTTDNGEWIARALSLCRLAGAPYDGILVDRGFLQASRGSTAMPTATLPPPQHVVGELFRPGKLPPAGLARPSPEILVAEQETPAPPGVTPASYGANAGDNLQYVGAYAPTWFGLAGVLACIYAAMLWRRYHPKL
jgi:surfeit locus 1 family protein